MEVEGETVYDYDEYLPKMDIDLEPDEEERVKPEIVRFNLECKKCGYAWEARKENPRRCPSCYARKWDGGDAT